MTFSEILCSSLCPEQVTPAWCEKCRKYQTTTQSRYKAGHFWSRAGHCRYRAGHFWFRAGQSGRMLKGQDYEQTKSFQVQFRSVQVQSKALQVYTRSFQIQSRSLSLCTKQVTPGTYRAGHFKYRVGHLVLSE